MAFLRFRLRKPSAPVSSAAGAIQVPTRPQNHCCACRTIPSSSGAAASARASPCEVGARVGQHRKLDRAGPIILTPNKLSIAVQGPGEPRAQLPTQRVDGWKRKAPHGLVMHEFTSALLMRNKIVVVAEIGAPVCAHCGAAARAGLNSRQGGGVGRLPLLVSSVGGGRSPERLLGSLYLPAMEPR